MSIKYLIIGMGVAGIAAAEAIRGLDPGGEITLVSKDQNGYYSLPGLAYYLSGEVAEDGLAPYKPADFERLQTRRVQGEAIRVDTAGRRVVLSDGTHLAYDRMLLCTGSQALMPDVPGIKLDGVVKLDNLEDAREILRHSKRARAAAVVGGGITALEIVEALVEHGIQVHYFLRGERYWSNILDEGESHIVEQALRELGVRLHFHAELAEIRGQQGKVRSLVTRAGEEIRCNLVAVAIGVQPRKELAERSGIKTQRGILVDERMRTDQTGIYAAGDVAQVYDPRSQKYVLDTLWGLAREQGRVAGVNMAGGEAVYRLAVPCNVTRLAGLPTMIIGSVGQGKDADLRGIGRGDSEAWRDHPAVEAVQIDNPVHHLRLLVGQTTLTGAVLIGDQGLGSFLRLLISEQVDISPIRSRLFAPGADLAKILIDYYSRGRDGHETRGA